MVVGTVSSVESEKLVLPFCLSTSRRVLPPEITHDARIQLRVLFHGMLAFPLFVVN